MVRDCGVGCIVCIVCVFISVLYLKYYFRQQLTSLYESIVFKMAHANFSLLWDSHKNNICQGLSSLQQNGEFVDMTLAADGHMVKVHQIVIALASPYLKELIASAQCPHPVIFLNKVSYTTLSALLEYIYMGEVLVAKDGMNQLLEAARELHIHGLQDMRVELSTETQIPSQRHSGKHLAKSRTKDTEVYNIVAAPSVQHEDNNGIDNDMDIDEREMSEAFEELVEEIEQKSQESESSVTKKKDPLTSVTALKPTKDEKPTVQYTVTNQGVLQMILNRFLYYLRYTARGKVRSSAKRKWRCINYTRETTLCPASVVTMDDVVIKRYGAHNHPFHDAKILRKVRENAVFTRLVDAETTGAAIRRPRKSKAADKSSQDAE